MAQKHVSGKPLGRVSPHRGCIAASTQTALTGKPFNIASYALLTHLLAQQCDLQPGEFIWTGGDCHLYLNHEEQVRTQLAREPRLYPRLLLRRRPPSVFDYAFEDFELQGYDPHPAIKAPVAV